MEGEIKAHPATEGDHSAGRRAREVYRYFRPERLSTISENASLSSGTSLQSGRLSHDDTHDQSVNKIDDLSVPIVNQPSTPQSSQESWAPLESLPNSLVLGEASSTLDSFAQLAALRLNVDRVFISVSDRESQFIISQAGQTAKGNVKYDFLSDGVSGGCSTLDASSWSMCKDTIALSPSNRLTGEYNFLVSNDLTQDDRYKHLPLVKEEPNFRFYAGTPLTTESHINIGCFFVLDTKPHDEFTYLEKETMGHMGMLIMDFLKVSRQASEGRRASRLSRGLSHFVEGDSSFTTDSQNSSPGNTMNQQSNRSPAVSARRAFVDKLDARSVLSGRSRSRSSGACSFASASDSDDKLAPSSFDSKSASDWPHQKPKDDGEHHRGNAWTFRRAANLIRESLELTGNDGVIFVEAGNDPMQTAGSESDLSSSMDNIKAVSVLAMSTEDGGMEKKTPVSQSIENLDEDYFRRLLTRYQNGNIWSFHRDGLLTSSDNEESEGSNEHRGRTNPSLRRAKALKRKRTENSILNKCFPGATQILFVPLWNSARSQWFGGFFCWNTVESNVFNPSVELSSLLGFGTSIMSECNRVDSLIADRQKGDFLGSISHELRSPLHGVLAAAEMMRSTEMTPYQSSLMETIYACGRTLLDTMNQVLDYSKIVNLERQLRHLKKRGDQPPNRQINHRSAARLDVYTATDVSILAEEVVEGVTLGHQHTTIQQNQPLDHSTLIPGTNDGANHLGTTSISQPQVKVDVDIAHHDWVYNTPPGALRRIIMNLFSNALKYTSQGQVSLRLEVKEASESGCTQSEKADLVTVTVSDTGKGITDDFLRGRLFVPFAQEDTLAIGSGLGLSIVRSLLKTLGGNINVQTQLGKGTTVKVTIPLFRPESEDCLNNKALISPFIQDEKVTDDLYHIRRDYSGRKVAIWGLEIDSVSKHPFWSMISRYLTDWYSLELVSPSSDAAIDILLAEEIPSGAELSNLEQMESACKAPLLVISNQNVSKDSRTNWLQASVNKIRVVDIINRPCGPHKLGRLIRRCLEHPPQFDSTAETSTPEEPKNSSVDEKFKGIAVDEKTVSINPKSSSLPADEKPTELSQPENSKPNREARVLVVEDNMINLNLMLTFLKKQNNISTLDSAENGQLAVAAVKQESQSYDIIFMDISMPVMDGFEASRNIRAIEKGRNTNEKPATIVALTGLSSSEDESEALVSGMNLFLTKPVAFKQVKQILNEWHEANSLEQV